MPLNYTLWSNYNDKVHVVCISTQRGEKGDKKKLSSHFPNSQNLIHNRLNVRFQAVSHSVMSDLPHLETTSRFQAPLWRDWRQSRTDGPREPHLNCNPAKSFSLPGLRFSLVLCRRWGPGSSPPIGEENETPGDEGPWLVKGHTASWHGFLVPMPWNPWQRITALNTHYSTAGCLSSVVTSETLVLLFLQTCQWWGSQCAPQQGGSGRKWSTAQNLKTNSGDIISFSFPKISHSIASFRKKSQEPNSSQIEPCDIYVCMDRILSPLKICYSPNPWKQWMWQVIWK